jgi:hypothetical protein
MKFVTDLLSLKLLTTLLSDRQEGKRAKSKGITFVDHGDEKIR